MNKLKAAKSPVIYVGNGVRLAKREKQFIELAERLDVPVVTTISGSDIIWYNHPLFFGKPDICGDRIGNIMVQNSDLLIILGTRLGLRQLSYAYDLFAPKAYKVMVGKWRNAENPHWHKVYLDDYDADGFFWGKEWDESEDVHEEDLNYHGNGWFLWKSEGKLLTELHSMDVQNVKVPKVWRVQHLSTCAALQPNDSLILVDKTYRTHRFHFTKVNGY